MDRKMKDSGVEWIGEIPEDWGIVRLKNVAKLITGNTPSKAENDKYYSQNGLMWIKPDNLYGFTPTKETNEYLNDEGKFIARVVPPCTPLVCCIGTIGKVGYALKETAFNQQINAIMFNSKLYDWKYGIYYISCQEEQQWYYANGNVVQILNSSNQGNILLPYISIKNQLQIVNYLDNKCTKIDETIEKQKQVIEKLKAYKQSIITEAVTKGLNPDVAMQDSGIEWIGEIPEHWKVKKLKYLGWLSANGVDKKIYENEELYKSVHYMNVYNNSLKEIEDNDNYLIVSATSIKAENCTLKKGDVLFTNSSETPDDMGHSTVVKKDLDKTLFGYHLMRFRPYCNMALHYEKYVFGCYYLRKWFEYRSTGMTRYGIAYSDFAEAKIIIPPIEEQTTIANHLDQKCTKIDTTISKKESLIEKLTEYKKSLIYECVTGKIEV